MNAQHAVPKESTEFRQDENGHHAYYGETYYRLPPVRHSTYHWIIAVGCFSIGTAGAAQLLSTVLKATGLPDKDPLLRSGRYAAFAGSLITPALYIGDLGAPRKWYNMLRIFRRTSLMSVGGAWLLTAFGAASGAVALGQLLEDRGYRKVGSVFAGVFGIPAALAGSFMSVYMGTELEETSTPLWAEVSPLLPPLFGLNNASSALALFELTGEAAHVSEETTRPVRFLAILTEAAAIAQLRRVELRWTRSARVSSRYRSRYGLLYRTGLVTLAKAAGLITRIGEFLGLEEWRTLRPFAAAATLATGYALPWVLLEQGNRSADRAEDSFEQTSPVPVERSRAEARAEGHAPGQPRSLSLLKWLAVGGLAVGTFALLMRPKKAY